MNALIEAAANYLQQSAFTTLFFDAGLKSLAVLTVAGGVCVCCWRAAAATRHWIWFLGLVSLLCLPLLACMPRTWHQPLWSVSTGFNSGNQFSPSKRRAISTTI